MLLLLLPIITTVLFEIFLNMDSTLQQYYIGVIFLSGLGLFFNIYIIVIYSKDEINKNRAIEEYNRQNQALRKIVEVFRSVFTNDAKALNGVFHQITALQTDIDISTLSINYCCNDLCRMVYDVLFNYCRQPDIEVTYVYRVDLDNISTIGFYNTTQTPPRVYNITRSIRSDKIYFDAMQFVTNGSYGSQSIGEQDVYKKLLRALGDSQPDKYKQYISVPVLCDGGSMIGLIQAVAYSDTRFATDDKSLKNLTNTYLGAFSHLFLMKHKTEKVIAAKPKVAVA